MVNELINQQEHRRTKKELFRAIAPKRDVVRSTLPSSIRDLLNKENNSPKSNERNWFTILPRLRSNLPFVCSSRSGARILWVFALIAHKFIITYRVSPPPEPEPKVGSGRVAQVHVTSSTIIGAHTDTHTHTWHCSEACAQSPEDQSKART